MPEPDPKKMLLQAFEEAIAAAQPARVLAAFVPPAPTGRIVVVGAGKASAQMARALEDAMGRPLEGVVVTQYGCACDCRGIQVVVTKFQKCYLLWRFAPDAINLITDWQRGTS